MSEEELPTLWAIVRKDPTSETTIVLSILCKQGDVCWENNLVEGKLYKNNKLVKDYKEKK